MILKVMHCHDRDRDFGSFPSYKAKISPVFSDPATSDIRWDSLKELSSIQHRRNSRPSVYNGNVRYHLREINKLCKIELEFKNP